MHEHAVPPPGQPGRLPALLERRAVLRRRAGRARCELAVLLRQGALARDPHRAVRAGDRHPARGAEGAGRPSSRLVRRAVDHLDLRPLRGERPLLRRRCSRSWTRRTRSRRTTLARRRRSASSSSTTARSGAGTGRCTTRSAAPRTCGSRTACCRPGRRSSTSSRTRRSTTGSSASWRTPTGRCGARCRSGRPRTTSTPPPARGSRRGSTGRGTARSPSTELVLRQLLPLAHEGLTEWGVQPASRDRFLGIIEQRCLRQANGASWQADDRAPVRGRGSRPARRAAEDAGRLRRAHALERPGPLVAAGLTSAASMATPDGPGRAVEPDRLPRRARSRIAARRRLGATESCSGWLSLAALGAVGGWTVPRRHRVPGGDRAGAGGPRLPDGPGRRRRGGGTGVRRSARRCGGPAHRRRCSPRSSRSLR